VRTEHRLLLVDVWSREVRREGGREGGKEGGIVDAC